MTDSREEKPRAVLNCGARDPSTIVRFTYRCPMMWADMEETDDPGRRHCAACVRDVFWCRNTEEAALRAEQGECIAVPVWLVEAIPPREGEPMITISGTPERPGDVLREAEAAYLAARRGGAS